MSTLVFAIRTLSLAWLTIVQTLLPQFSKDTMVRFSEFFSNNYEAFFIVNQ